jgi:hypothetical protein
MVDLNTRLRPEDALLYNLSSADAINHVGRLQQRTSIRKRTSRGLCALSRSTERSAEAQLTD